VDTELRPVDHEPEPTGDDAVVDATDAGDAGDTGQDSPLPNLRDLEPDWEASDADVLDQHRDVPLDDER
jgi:hypothetical protein